MDLDQRSNSEHRPIYGVHSNQLRLCSATKPRGSRTQVCCLPDLQLLYSHQTFPNRRTKTWSLTHHVGRGIRLSTPKTILTLKNPFLFTPRRMDPDLHPALNQSFLRLTAQVQDTITPMFASLILLPRPLAVGVPGIGCNLVPETSHGSLLSLFDGPLPPMAVRLPLLALDTKATYPPFRLITTPAQPHANPSESASHTLEPSRTIRSLIQAPTGRCLKDESTSFTTPRKQPGT